MGGALVPLVQEAKMTLTIEQINKQIERIRVNREHFGDCADQLIAICERAREYEARRMTGQPATYRDPIICNEW